MSFFLGPMHEVSVAQSIVDTVIDKANEMGAHKVTEITLAIGDLSFISVEQIIFWIESFLKDSVGEGARVQVNTITGKVRCNNCEMISDVIVKEDPESHFSMPVFSCNYCKSDNTTICQGREMLIEKIRIEQ